MFQFPPHTHTILQKPPNPRVHTQALSLSLSLSRKIQKTIPPNFNMEPSSIPPPPPTTAVPFPGEVNEHPAPPIPEAAAVNHPPYAEMIYTAIEALKEKDGSSKRAIAKYIEQVYKEQLPPNHSTLLTHHLNRLKTTGMLQMVKKSYALPRSAPLPGLQPQLPPAADPSPRPRGRPRKAQNPVHNLPQPQPQPQAHPQETVNVQQNAEPVWAALGLADEPVQPETTKKRPGRPKKNSTPGAGPARRGRPPGSGKRPGRPPKAKTDADQASAGPKRGPGRPPKNQTQATPIPFAQPAGAESAAEPAPAAVADADAGAVLGPRSRGRPKKYADEVVAAGRGRGRGRGRGGRGRGRGRGGLPPQPRPGARPVGRPKKGSTYASTSQNTVSEDLRRKLEHFQSKVKESLAVIKPHFNHESPVTAIAAIQELEELGTMDLNAPLRDEPLPQQEELPQPPVQQQLQPPRQQLPPQQQQQQPPQQNLPPQQLPPQAPIFQQDFSAFHLQPFQHHQQHLQFQQQQPPQPQQLFQPPPQHHQQFHP